MLRKIKDLIYKPMYFLVGIISLGEVCKIALVTFAVVFLVAILNITCIFPIARKLLFTVFKLCFAYCVCYVFVVEDYGRNYKSREDIMSTELRLNKLRNYKRTSKYRK